MLTRNFLLVFCFLTCFLTAFGQETKPNLILTNNELPTTVNFCDLINNTKMYSGKLVRVRALYLTEFEKSSLYSPKCYIYDYPYVTWVEFDKSFKDCAKKGVKKKLNKMKEGISSDVVFVGKFETEGKYGQLDMYLYQLNVTCVENVRDAGQFKPLPDEKK